MVILHLQTVFEGQDTNTPERGPEVVKKLGNTAPVGYDAHVDGARVSIMMAQYGTGGTPWTIVIDRKGVVRMNEVTPPDAGVVATLVDKLRQEK